MKRSGVFVYILIVFFTGLLLMGAGYPANYFEMIDPVGDDYGYGSYQYPTNIAFKPYQGLFDLTRFKVWSEKPGEIYFDTSFGMITNPWSAPEGFIHQNLRIFINTRPGGFLNLPQPGAYVRFHPQAAWEVCLKIVGWENSQLMVLEGSKLKVWPLKTEVLGDGHTIRAKVAQTRIGIPDQNWQYYLLVGSYDGFGEDYFRKVKRKNSEWVIGGGLDRTLEPQVMDLLAPATGPATQEKQLSSFNRKTRQLAQLTPVGPRRGANIIWKLLGWLAIILVAGVIVVLFLIKRKRISGFWVAPGKQ
jgi:carbohydrate-binding DOMON domain-containing protein